MANKTPDPQPGQIFQDHQRLVKAIALADLLWELEVSPAQARSLTSEQWAQSARLAGVRAPHSQETKDRVCQLLEQRQTMRDRVLHASVRAIIQQKEKEGE